MSRRARDSGRILWAVSAALVITGCGGSGGGDTGPAPDSLLAQKAVAIDRATETWAIDSGGVGGDSGGDGGAAGAAGDGSALKRATVMLLDAQGKSVTGTTDDNGRYLLKFKTADFKPPYVVKVVDAGGNVLASTTDQTIAAGQVARINVNPLTDKITSDVLSSSVSGTDKTFTGADIDAGRLPAVRSSLRSSIAPALQATGLAGTDSFDPVAAIYQANGTGVDAIIESISHTREPATGATQLIAKLSPWVTASDGTVAPTLITPTSPMGTSQVALSASPSLTFDKINAWVTGLNRCLAMPSAQADADPKCTAERFVSNNYKHNSKDLERDWITLFSNADGGGVVGSSISNPVVMYIGRYNGSTSDNLAIVEVTVRQPGTGPLAGSRTDAILYTKTLIFKRDDTLTNSAAGNWILHGNQRNFNWSIEPRYFTVQQLNPAAADWASSRTYSAIRLTFTNTVWSAADGKYVSAKVYAVRLKGPGLAASGVVYAPTSTTPSATFTVLNRTGDIPAPGTLSPGATPDFRIAAATYPTGAPLSTWPTNSAGYPATQFTDFASLRAFNQYTIEIYQNGAAVPFVETGRILAPVATPQSYVQRPLHDLSPSLDQIQPPQPATSSVTAKWVRNPLAVRIDSAYFFTIIGGVGRTSSVSLPDSLAVSPTSTSIVIPISQGSVPAFGTTPAGDSREFGIAGGAARASFQQSIFWTN
jgi:hypothetical protein